jgi:hypothetical protein
MFFVWHYQYRKFHSIFYIKLSIKSLMDKKIYLSESQMPTHWYNVIADMPNKPLPPLHPGYKTTRRSQRTWRLCFLWNSSKQEVSPERYHEIPDQVAGYIQVVEADTFGHEQRHWKRCWIRRPKFITNMKVQARAGHTSPIQPCHRHTTASRKASKK